MPSASTLGLECPTKVLLVSYWQYELLGFQEGLFGTMPDVGSHLGLPFSEEGGRLSESCRILGGYTGSALGY